MSGGFSSGGLLVQRNGAPLLLVYTIDKRFPEAALEGRRAVFSPDAHGSYSYCRMNSLMCIITPLPIIV